MVKVPLAILLKQGGRCPPLSAKSHILQKKGSNLPIVKNYVSRKGVKTRGLRFFSLRALRFSER